MTRNEDVRSKKIAFVSSCFMNVNNKVKGLARYKGMYTDLLELFMKNDISIQQMDCPETLYLGINRWSATKNLYSGIGFRRFCRELAQKQVDYMQSYYDAGYEIVGVFCINGSPSCGYTVTCYDERWGGALACFEDGSSFVSGKGVLIEELIESINDRKIVMPKFYGVDLEDESISLDTVKENLRKIIEKEVD